MSRRLPSVPNLDHLKKQAKDVLRVSRPGRPQWRLADAQQALARGYGFATWAALKLHVESIRPEPATAASDRRDLKERTCSRSSHPIEGIWAACPDTSPAHPTEIGTVVVEFAQTSEGLVLTQIGPGDAGCDVAMKVAIHVDGVDHPVPFGDNVTLRASWIDAQTLETIARRDEQLAWRATYTVSDDGQSLVISSAERLVRFERVHVE